MDTPLSRHPSDHALRSFGMKKLDDPAAADVAAHLENCMVCQERVTGVMTQVDSTSTISAQTSSGPTTTTRGATTGLRARFGLAHEPGESWDAVGEIIRLGRDPLCEISLDSATHTLVAGIHARIEMGPDGFVLVQLAPESQTLLTCK
jgi:hypothetical protein